MIDFSMSCRACKGKQYIFAGQLRSRFRCAYVVADKYDGFCFVRAQHRQNRVQLRIPHNDKNHIVPIRRRKRGHNRDPRNGHARRKFVFDPQTVFPDLLRPVSARKQCYLFSGTKQIAHEIAAKHPRAIHQNSHIQAPLLLYFPYSSPPCAFSRSVQTTRDSTRLAFANFKGNGKAAHRQLIGPVRRHILLVAERRRDPVGGGACSRLRMNGQHVFPLLL